MAAKCKPVKTAHEFNNLTSKETVGTKTVCAIAFDGGNAAEWKSQLAELNDIAEDFWERASLVALDARFHKAIMEKVGLSANGQAALFKADNPGGASIISWTDFAAFRAELEKAC